MPQPFDELPKSITDRGRTVRLAGGRVPALLVHPHWDAHAGAATRAAPVLIWMHGRTVRKELDPGRYLMLARAGIASCALDLPGHGERMDAALQAPERTLEAVVQMAGELDAVVSDLRRMEPFATNALAVGGMSAGGMAALVRLTSPHPFAAALVESTTGSWRWQRSRAMHNPDLVAAHNPLDHLSGWREIPLLGIHSTLDAWVPVEGQREFFAAVRSQSRHPERIVLHEYAQTGAPFEHVGFGRLGRAAKALGAEFLSQYLLGSPSQ